MSIFKHKASWILLLLTALFLIPVASAWLIYYQYDRFSFNTTSNGALIDPPFPLTMLKLVTSTGDPFIQGNTAGKWILLYFQPHCDNFCQTQLDHVQGSRLALGKNMVRVRTILVTQPEQEHTELRKYLSQNPDIIHLLADQSAFSALDQYLDDDQHSAQSNLIIVDPLGNALIRYNGEVYSTVVYKDLQHLLKVSQIG